jgi:hypothetical protein
MLSCDNGRQNLRLTSWTKSVCVCVRHALLCPNLYFMFPRLHSPRDNAKNHEISKSGYPATRSTPTVDRLHQRGWLSEWFHAVLKKQRIQTCLYNSYSMPQMFGLWMRRLGWAVSFTPRPLYPRGKDPWYPLGRRLGGPQNRSGQREEEKILDPTGTRTLTHWSSSP